MDGINSRNLSNACGLFVLGLLLCACRDAREEPLSGILITLDTTNAPALGCYGERKGITPNLDELAAESLVYDNARSVAPLTLPSHSSMMTGLYPIRHLVRDNGLTPLPESASTLAERAKDAGYQTAAFVAAVVISAPYGLAQGFDTYEDPSALKVRELPAPVITKAAQDWLAARDRTRPFFLWVHYFDPHAPHQPEARFLEQVEASTDARFPGYLGEIAQVDHSVGELLDTLRAEGLLESSFVAVVADHGESLYRHGEPTHSILVYDTTILVPFFLRYPDLYRSGERSAEIVSVADIYPTFLDALRLEPAPDLDGLSLYRRQIPADRGVYFESYAGYLSCGWSPLSGWADANGTYIHSTAPELYAATDRLQTSNQLLADPARARAYRRQISLVADRARLPAAETTLDEEFRSHIKELGYLGGADPDLAIPHPFETGDLPNPSENIAQLTTYLDASVLAGEGKRQEAIAMLEECLKDSENLMAAELLGQLYSQEGRLDDTIRILRKVTTSGVHRGYSNSLLGGALEQTGRVDEAIEVYLKAHEIWPKSPKYLEGLIRCFERLGKETEAARFKAKLDAL